MGFTAEPCERHQTSEARATGRPRPRPPAPMGGRRRLNPQDGEPSRASRERPSPTRPRRRREPASAGPIRQAPRAETDRRAHKVQGTQRFERAGIAPPRPRRGGRPEPSSTNRRRAEGHGGNIYVVGSTRPTATRRGDYRPARRWRASPAFSHGSLEVAGPRPDAARRTRRVAVERAAPRPTASSSFGWRSRARPRLPPHARPVRLGRKTTSISLSALG